jgi:predicted acyltransferase
LLHAEWDGWTPTDLIFPFFLVIVGVAIGLGTRRVTVATVLRRGSIDRMIFGRHLWRQGNWDPEGLFSTMPALATTLLGVIAGWFIRETESPRALVRGLVLGGLGLIVLGLLVSVWLPINKNLWTSSYVLFTAGLAAAFLAVCYWLCDVRESAAMRRITEPMVALGRNAILLFVVSGLFAKTLIYLKWPGSSQPLGGWIYVSVPTARVSQRLTPLRDCKPRFAARIARLASSSTSVFDGMITR